MGVVNSSPPFAIFFENVTFPCKAGEGMEIARLRTADNPCVGVCPILRRTCAQPVVIRAMPENEIPRVLRGDIYYIVNYLLITAQAGFPCADGSRLAAR